MTMRYTLAEDFSVYGQFRTGRAVTCELFDGLTGAAIALTANVATEIGTTGVYRFGRSNIDNPIIAYTTIVWQMLDTASNRTDSGFIVVGGGIPDGSLTLALWLALH